VRAGRAQVMDDREVTEVAWCDRADLTERVPYPLSGPVQVYLDAALVWRAAVPVSSEMR